MKIKLDIDCTPEEARAFFGLPDVKPLQEALLPEVEERLRADAQGDGPRGDAEDLAAGALKGFEQLQEMFLAQMAAARQKEITVVARWPDLCSWCGTAKPNGICSGGTRAGADSPLTERGVAQADAIGRLLRSLPEIASAGIVASPLGRARSTAEMISEYLGRDRAAAPRRSSVRAVSRLVGRADLSRNRNARARRVRRRGPPRMVFPLPGRRALRCLCRPPRRMAAGLGRAQGSRRRDARRRDPGIARPLCGSAAGGTR